MGTLINTLKNSMMPNVWLGFGWVYAFLILATVIASFKGSPEVKLRIRTWWMIVTLVLCALAASRPVSLLFFAFISFLGLKEYLSIIPTRRADRRVLFWAYLAIPIQFYWIYTDWYGMFIIFIPVYLFLFLPLRMVLIGETKGFLNAAGTLHWGLMMTVFTMGHVAYLVSSRPSQNPVAHGAGLAFYLFLLTELNDVAQFLWGKSMGRTRITPTVSPNKTLAGFMGGVATTTCLAWALAPTFTPLTPGHAVLVGLLISISGFFGDVVISAVKRDLGIKDTGSLLPGHGGMLDRVDSLTYTAPIFFHFMRYFYG